MLATLSYRFFERPILRLKNVRLDADGPRTWLRSRTDYGDRSLTCLGFGLGSAPDPVGIADARTEPAASAATGATAARLQPWRHSIAQDSW